MGEESVQEAKVVTTIPSLNEERSIERSVRSLMAQDLPASWHVIHVVDGGSSDRTIDIVKELKNEAEREGGPTIRIIRNPERFSPQARNLSLESCPKDTEFIFEMSSHAWVPQDHLRQRINDLRDIEESEGIRVGSVGCRIVDADDDVPFIGQWIEHALANPLGAGGGQFARFSGRHPSMVPPFSLYRKEALEAVGGWDPFFRTTQDSDLNLRLNRAGWPTWRSDVSHVHQVKRRSVRAWIKFGHRYGFWRMQHVKREISRINPAEFAPLLGLLVTVSLAATKVWFWPIPIAAYVIALLLAGTIESMRGRKPTLIVGVPLMLFILHTTFTIGLLDGMRRGPREIVSNTSEQSREDE